MSGLIPDTDFPGYRFPNAAHWWLPMSTLQEGALYVIDARNAFLGVWQANVSGFQIARPLFEPRPGGRRMVWHQRGHYPFVEYHWDTGEPLGTARPLVFIEQVSKAVENDLLAYLIDAEQRITKEIAFDIVQKSIDFLKF
jgi:hypothetical protein